MSARSRRTKTLDERKAPPRYPRFKVRAEDLAMNKTRAVWAREALKRLEEIVGTSEENAVQDMLEYMMHLCDHDQAHPDFDEAMEGAISAYESFTAVHPNWE